MKKILVIYPYSVRALDQLSSIELLLKKYSVFLLILDKEGFMQIEAKKYGAEIVKYNQKFLKKNFIVKYIYLFLITLNFVKKNKIKIIFSHLETSCFIASIVNFFYKLDHYYFKHNTDAYSLDSNFKGKILNFVVNFFPKKIICTSKKVFDFLKKKKLLKNKLYLIPYGFNFKFFKKIKPIKNKTKIINFICIGRLVESKRINLVLDFFNKLKLKNYKKKITILGNGPLKKIYEDKYKSKNIKFLGFKNNPEFYINKSDILLHFSSTESFGHVVMEAAIKNKSIIACNNVGVFNEFIINKKNGFLVSIDEPIKDSLKIFATHKINKIKNIGSNLSKIIYLKYNINHLSKLYEKLINEAN